jgi:hypothetical protein
MSDRLTSSQVRGCLRAALHDAVVGLGGFGSAAGEAGADEKTLRRWHKREAGDWTAEAIGGLIAGEMAVDGHSLIIERLSALCSSRPHGEPLRAQSDVVAALEGAGRLVAAIGAALKNGRVEPHEAGALALLIRSRQRDEAQVLADLDALAGGALCR